MPRTQLTYDCPVALLGAAALSDALFDDVLVQTGVILAADGGAAHALRREIMPQAVIGDLDSIGPDLMARIPADRLNFVDDQETTDFDKALRSINAPLIIGAGFSGDRADHTLATYTVLARYPERRCILVGEKELVFLCPPRLEMAPRVGSWFSLYPLGPVAGTSQGLEWPIDGLSFAPDQKAGTSNRVISPMDLTMESPLMLGIMPRAALPELVRAVLAAPLRWPSRAAQHTSPRQT